MNPLPGCAPILATALLAGACADPQAIEKCEGLVDAICVNVTDACFPPMTVEQCLEELDATLGCAEAFDVSDSYDACLEEVSAAEDCLPTAGLPAACEGAILVLE